MRKIAIYLIFIIISVIVGLYSWMVFFPDHAKNTIIEMERDNAGLKPYDIKVNGMKIKYLTGGQGETLLLIHGFGANKDNWTRVAKYLTPHFKVIALDLVGFGESARPKGIKYSITEQMERVRTFTDILNLKSFHIGGSSMGGNISAVFAANHPGYIKSLWLLAPSGVLTSEKSELMSLVKKGKNPLIAKDKKGYNELLEFVFYKKPFIPAPILDSFAKEATKNSPLNEIVYKAFKTNPIAIEKALKKSKIPTLIIWGKEDRVLHYSGAKILGENLINSTVELYEKTGHLPMIEKPKKSAKSYLKFHKFK